MAGVLIQRGECIWAHRHKWGEHHVRMEAKIRVIHLQVKECQGLPATPEVMRQNGTDFSLGSLEKAWPSDYYPPELQEDKFLLFLATHFVRICYGSLRRLIHEVNLVD